MSSIANDPDGAVADRFRELRRTKSTAMRNELVEQHRGVAAAIARRFANRGEPLDDLEQVASIGLVKAVERFDPDRGVPFVGFAVPTITGELRRHFRDRTWTLKVSRRAKDLYAQMPATVERLTAELGRSPTPNELAEALDRSVDEVLDALDAGAAYRPLSTDVEVPPTGRPLVNRTEDVADAAEERLLVREVLDQLPAREREIVQLRFFEELTQSEIADRIGVSQVHVSRLLRRALDAMQGHLSAELEPSADDGAPS